MTTLEPRKHEFTPALIGHYKVYTSTKVLDCCNLAFANNAPMQLCGISSVEQYVDSAIKYDYNEFMDNDLWYSLCRLHDFYKIALAYAMTNSTDCFKIKSMMADINSLLMLNSVYPLPVFKHTTNGYIINRNYKEEAKFCKALIQSLLNDNVTQTCISIMRVVSKLPQRFLEQFKYLLQGYVPDKWSIVSTNNLAALLQTQGVTIHVECDDYVVPEQLHTVKVCEFFNLFYNGTANIRACLR